MSIDIDISLSPLMVRFHAFGKDWKFAGRSGQCEPRTERSPVPKTVPDEGGGFYSKLLPQHPFPVASPDGHDAMLIRQYNLWLIDLHDGNERQLTSDGRDVSERPVIAYAFPGNDTKPQLRILKGACPGDEQVDRLHMAIVDIGDGTVTSIDRPPQAAMKLGDPPEQFEPGLSKMLS